MICLVKVGQIVRGQQMILILLQFRLFLRANKIAKETKSLG
jgi:hypothetical protein